MKTLPPSHAVAGRQSHCNWLFLLLLLVSTIPGLAQSPPPPTNSGAALDSWAFSDTNHWASEAGYRPISFTNVTVGTGDSTAAEIDSPHPAWLKYSVWQTNATNLTVTQGTVSLWFAPNWAGTNQGGLGPQVSGRLIEAGTYTTNATNGWWSLLFDNPGCHLSFSAQNATGHQTNYLTAPISWTSNAWHNVVLTYSSTNSSLYLDGVIATNGPGVTIYPSSQVLSNGFTMGSDAATGIDQVHGTFDDVSTYSYPLSAGTINVYYTLYGLFFGVEEGGGGGGFTNAPSEPETLPTFQAVSGPGFLTNPYTNGTGCVTSNRVWLTNVVAVFTNGAVNFSFTIAGGSNGLPYDVFATTAIEDPITNAVWSWMGQGFHCVNYTLAGLTNNPVFILLGTPLDTDGDGLTDAYERLVSHTNPYVAASSGDGILDGWKVLWGLGLNINNSAQPGNRKNYTYDGTGRLETLSGVLGENGVFDAEGNLTSDQQ